MKKCILVILITCVISKVTFAGQDGNGGGIIKDGEHLKTMAEAGVLLQRVSNLVSNIKYPDYFDLSEDTKIEVVKLISLLPISPKGKENLANEVIGNKATFITSKEISQLEYKKIIADYAATLKAYNHKFDESLFSLAAVTLDSKEGVFTGKTILLPTFSKLSPKQQAVILIHERNFRYANEEFLKDKKKLLGIILELDTQIFELMRAQEQGITLDPMRIIAVLKDLGIATEYNVAYYAIKNLQNKTKNPILVEDFIGLEFYSPSTMPIDPSLVKRLNKYDPRTLQIFENAELKMHTSAYGAGWLTYSPTHETVTDAITRICNTVYPQMKNNSKQIIYAQDYALLAFSCNENHNLFDGILEISGAKAVY